MKAFGIFFSDMLRLVAWRGPRDGAAAMTPAQFVALGAAMILLELVTQMAIGGQWRYFQLYGVDSIFGRIAVTFAIILLFARIDAKPPTARHLALLVFGLTLGSDLLGVGTYYTAKSMEGRGLLATILAWSLLTLPLLLVVWTSGGARKVFALVTACRRPTLRAVGFSFCLWLALTAWPEWPMLPGADFEARRANWWELASAIRSRAAESKLYAEAEVRFAEAEQRRVATELAQPARLETALAQLAPRAAKKRNVFVLAIAGSDSETVFESETRRSLEILTRRLGAEGHALSLVNGEAKEGQPPLATVQNIAESIRGVAARMDKDNDLLVLAMSSHGSKEGFSLQKEHFFERLLDPKALRGVLDDAGVKNRLVIVSACHSGVFVPEFSDARSAVVTAASAERTSFGCANDRDWTYFGEAFYDHGVKEKESIPAAFEAAQGLIASWEAEQRLTPSQPQIFLGEEFKRRFPDLAGGAPQSAESPRPAPAKRTVADKGPQRVLK